MVAVVEAQKLTREIKMDKGGGSVARGSIGPKSTMTKKAKRAPWLQPSRTRGTKHIGNHLCSDTACDW
jgi:hypothetical protein